MKTFFIPLLLLICSSSAFAQISPGLEISVGAAHSYAISNPSVQLLGREEARTIPGFPTLRLEANAIWNLSKTSHAFLTGFQYTQRAWGTRIGLQDSVRFNPFGEAVPPYRSYLILSYLDISLSHRFSWGQQTRYFIQETVFVGTPIRYLRWFRREGGEREQNWAIPINQFEEISRFVAGIGIKLGCYIPLTQRTAITLSVKQDITISPMIRTFRSPMRDVSTMLMVGFVFGSES